MKNQPMSAMGGSGNYSPLIAKNLLEGNGSKLTESTSGAIKTKEEFKASFKTIKA